MAGGEGDLGAFRSDLHMLSRHMRLPFREEQDLTVPLMSLDVLADLDRRDWNDATLAALHFRGGRETRARATTTSRVGDVVATTTSREGDIGRAATTRRVG